MSQCVFRVSAMTNSASKYYNLGCDRCSQLLGSDRMCCAKNLIQV